MTSLTKRYAFHRTRPESLWLLAGAFVASTALLPGCSKEEPPPAVVVQEEAPPPPPPPPSPTDLFKLHNIDPRIEIAADEVPMGDSDPESGTRKLVAVLKFFDAMVRGSDQRLKPMLASADQKVLAELVQSGLFAPAAQRVTRVVLGCGSFQVGLESVDAVFALVQSGSNFEAQLWTYKLDDAGEAVFDAQPTPPEILSKLTGTKSAPRIRQWAAVLAGLVAEAGKPEEVIDFGRLDYGVHSEGTSEGGDSSPAMTPSSAPKRDGPGGKREQRPHLTPPRAPKMDGGH